MIFAETHFRNCDRNSDEGAVSVFQSMGVSNICCWVMAWTVDGEGMGATGVGFVASAARSAASLAARMAAMLLVPSIMSRRCFREFTSRFASEGMNLRLVPVSAASGSAEGASSGTVAAVPSAAFAVIHAGRLETPRLPLSLAEGLTFAFEDTAVGGGGGNPSTPTPGGGGNPGGSGGGTIKAPGGNPGGSGGMPSPPAACASRRSSISFISRFLCFASSMSSTRCFAAASLIRRSTTSARCFFIDASRSSRLRLNFATESRTSGAFKGSMSSSYAPPPTAALALEMSMVTVGVGLESVVVVEGLGDGFLLVLFSSRYCSLSFLAISIILRTTALL
mmetsp:Transcript_31703/g.36637  ORF Transcript_31703/g.36637 Transcript_31703/m.36637 type:complete len:336 (-) Transcript_31703:1166-2173(-)